MPLTKAEEDLIADIAVKLFDSASLAMMSRDQQEELLFCITTTALLLLRDVAKRGAIQEYLEGALADIDGRTAIRIVKPN